MGIHLRCAAFIGDTVLEPPISQHLNDPASEEVAMSPATRRNQIAVHHDILICVHGSIRFCIPNKIIRADQLSSFHKLGCRRNKPWQIIPSPSLKEQ
jgi:hypothetical protein